MSDPAQEARARALQKELRCLVCQGESLDESNASLAVDLRHLIRAQIKAGESDEQIKRFPGRALWRLHPDEAAVRAATPTPYG